MTCPTGIRLPAGDRLADCGQHPSDRPHTRRATDGDDGESAGSRRGQRRSGHRRSRHRLGDAASWTAARCTHDPACGRRTAAREQPRWRCQPDRSFERARRRRQAPRAQPEPALACTSGRRTQARPEDSVSPRSDNARAPDSRGRVTPRQCTHGPACDATRRGQTTRTPPGPTSGRGPSAP